MSELAMVATITSLVSAAISSAKNARDIAKDSSDHALKGALNDLYDSLLDIKDRALSLDEENRNLKTQLATRAKYTGPVEPLGYVYFADDDASQAPLCPKCFQATPQQIAFMSQVEPWNHGLRRECFLCHHLVYEKPMKF